MKRGPTEFELIDRLKGKATASGALITGIGDDAAVTRPVGETATSVDAVVEGVHFDRTTSGPELIAHKALATALSDLAAMAADPGEVYLTVGLSPGLPEGFAEDLADAFVERAAFWGVSLAGGDTVTSPALFVSVTAVGYAPPGERLLLRSGATPGDLVAVTGFLGGAGAGLLLLQGVATGSGLQQGERDRVTTRQLAPEPLLDTGRALRGSGVTSLIDLSDGLGADLGHVAAASKVAIAIEAERIPVDPAVAAVGRAAGIEALDLALGAGEDYELAMTVPPGRIEAVTDLVQAAGSRLSVVGSVSSGSGLKLLSDGAVIPVPRGFEHLG
jgi:thiamine-monophosphate kinase